MKYMYLLPFYLLQSSVKTFFLVFQYKNILKLSKQDKITCIIGSNDTKRFSENTPQ